MKNLAFTYWRDGKDWLGYLNDFPTYLAQGKSLADLRDHLHDLHRDLAYGK
jgi:predicted RNase H-like HicB family nuclease